MFTLTQIGWALFACQSWAQIRHVFTNVGLATSGRTYLYLGDLIFFSLPLIVMQLIQYRTRDLLIVLRLPLVLRATVFGGVIVWTVIFASRTPTEFIYFQF